MSILSLKMITIDYKKFILILYFITMGVYRYQTKSIMPNPNVFLLDT